jgi:hypothetical protein
MKRQEKKTNKLKARLPCSWLKIALSWLKIALQLAQVVILSAKEAVR